MSRPHSAVGGWTSVCARFLEPLNSPRLARLPNGHDINGVGGRPPRVLRLSSKIPGAAQTRGAASAAAPLELAFGLLAASVASLVSCCRALPVLLGFARLTNQGKCASCTLREFRVA